MWRGQRLEIAPASIEGLQNSFPGPQTQSVLSKVRVLDRFAHVLRGDTLVPLQISDRSRDFQNPIVRAGTEIQFGHSHTNQFL